MSGDRQQNKHPSDFDAVVVGAGFAGLSMLHRLRELGLSVRVYEAGSGVGGTWYWNRYPGARCDTVSMEYSYGFSDDLQQEWEWTEKYATQPELMAYANHVADRFDLRRDITFNTRVAAASFDDTTGCWRVKTGTGDSVVARYFILAPGILSSTNLPDFEGRDTFKGPTYHTGKWPHEGVDFSGMRVGVIGTGSSAVQVIPLVAEEADHLTVFQRTANYVVPAHNEALDARDVKQIKQKYVEFRKEIKGFPFGFTCIGTNKSAFEVDDAERRRLYEESWQRGRLMFLGSFNDILLDAEANRTASEFIREKIRAAVKDPQVAELLSPDFAVGCKRLCVGTEYFETYNRPNVTLVGVKETPIERITANGIVVDGHEHEVDAIVFATGYDAITGPIVRIDIRGRQGQSIRDKWSAGPRAYLGLMAAGFPNMFLMTGPGSPSVLSNLMVSIEQHVGFIRDVIAHMRDTGQDVIDPTVEAEDAWLAHVDEIADRTVYKSCDSWYRGSNISGKPLMFTAYFGVPPYAAECDEIAASGFTGFSMTSVEESLTEDVE